MGLFDRKLSTKESKAYEQEKAKALREYTREQEAKSLEKVREKARFDALPRTERAKLRVQSGITKFKSFSNKLESFDAKLEKKASAQGQSGGLILQSMRQDRQRTGPTMVEQSLAGPQGEGLIQQSLRGDVKKRR